MSRNKNVLVLVTGTHVHAQLPAAAASVLQEPGNKLLLSEELQSFNLKDRPKFRSTDQNLRPLTSDLQ